MKMNKLEMVVFCLALFLSSCGGPSYYFGPKGEQGVPGTAGNPGQDASPVTAVKLCPGETQYPIIFVEYAFCVQDKLYGTYSANGGFTTYLPPGHYNSAAINSSCSFNILERCNIEND